MLRVPTCRLVPCRQWGAATCTCGDSVGLAKHCGTHIQDCSMWREQGAVAHRCEAALPKESTDLAKCSGVHTGLPHPEKVWEYKSIAVPACGLPVWS